MTITVVDSLAAMRAVVDAPADWEDGVRRLWEPMAGMMWAAPDDAGVAQIHRQSFGFPWDRDAEQVSGGLEALERGDAWRRVRDALNQGSDVLRAEAGVQIPDISVLVLLGDPGDDHFMAELRGLSAFGGISGYIVLTLWPNHEVIDRLEAIAVHELHHNVRYSRGGVVWDPATVTVGEQVVAEGLADAFARQLYGDLGYTHFATAIRDDDAVLATVAASLDVTGMQHFTAWIHGDSSARRFGVEPVGLPTGAGYAAGNRFVDAYLRLTGRTAAQGVHDDARAITATATAELGLGSRPHVER